MQAKNPQVKDADKNKAYNAALRLLTSREYSKRELYLKLRNKYTDDAALDAVKRCIAEGWQSDDRYIQMLIRHMELKLYGPVKFRQEALKKGLSEELIAPYMESTDWLSFALEALKHKYGELKLDYSGKQKALAMLYRRGFTAGLCTKALSLFLDEGDDF